MRFVLLMATMAVGAASLGSQPEYQDWPERGATGTALIDNVGCKGAAFEEGYDALRDGNHGAAQLIFARGLAEGDCHMFEAGQEVFRDIGWFYMNDMEEAIRILPSTGTPYEEIYDLGYWVVAEFFHFPK